MKTWIMNRLKERSTWAGLITLAGIIGITLSPEQKELIVTILSGLGALILTFTADKNVEATVVSEPAKVDNDQRIQELTQ